MIFCPTCHCLLLVQKSVGEMLFICYSCPYFYPVFGKVAKKTAFDNVVEDEIFGESKTDTTEATCAKCGHETAYFVQMQTRSADEPSTIFYRCCNPRCQHTWKEN